MRIYKPVLGVLIMLACGGFMMMMKNLCFEPAMIEKEGLMSQIEANNMVIEGLKDYAGYNPQALENNTKMIQKLEEQWVNGFPGLYKDEDIILYIKGTEEDRGTNITSLDIGDSMKVESLGANYDLSVRNATFNYEESYYGFKGYIQYLTSKYPQTSLNNLTMTYNETDETVSGSFDVYLYYVEKSDYAKPDVLMDQGISNIFQAEGRMNDGKE